MSAVIPTVVAGSTLAPVDIILKTRTDWDQWIRNTTRVIKDRRMIDYADLTKPDPGTTAEEGVVINKPEPTYPPYIPDEEITAAYSTGTDNAKQLMNARIKQMEQRRADFDRFEKARAMVNDYIWKTTTNFGKAVMDEAGDTILSKLRCLERNYGPDDTARDALLTKEMNRLMKSVKTSLFENWAMDWKLLRTKMVKTNHPLLKLLRQNFIAAVTLRDAHFGSFQLANFT